MQRLKPFFTFIGFAVFVLLNAGRTGFVYGTECLEEKENTPVIFLYTPDFKGNILEITSGIRPIHLIRPQIGAKTVYNPQDPAQKYIMGYSWGHGGAGITLAPGSAKKAYEEIFREANAQTINLQKENIAVLGGGINGLWMAKYLVQQGIPASQITVYAEDFKTTVSHKAAGMWLPVSLPKRPEDLDFFTALERDSYHAYYRLAHKKNAKIKGVRELPLYTLGDITDAAEAIARQGLVPAGMPVILKNQHQKEIKAVYWEGGFFLVDPDQVMPSLKKYLKAKGVSFSHQKFTDEKDFFTLNASVVVNCLGFGNKDLLPEEGQQLQPSKGELVFLAPQPNISYMFFGRLPSGQILGFIPKPDKLVVGVTRKVGDESAFPNADDAKKLLEEGHLFFSDPSDSHQKRPLN